MARRSTRWTTSLLCVLLLVVPTLALENDFSFYPKGAQSCLDKAASQSECSGGDSAALNKCLCGNGGDFITNAASCIGKSSSGDVKDTYDTMQKACSTSGTPMEVSQAEFMSAAEGTTTTKSSSATKTASSSTRTATSTQATTTDASTQTSTSATASATTAADSSESNEKSGLSTGATIGISVGASVGGVALVAAIAFVLFRRYRRREPEADPMLPMSSHMPTTFPPTEPMAGYASYNDFKSHSPAPTAPTSTATPDPSSHPHASWVSPSPSSFHAHPQQGYAQPPPFVQPQAQPQAHAVAELASDALPGSTPFTAVEMPGSMPEVQK